MQHTAKVHQTTHIPCLLQGASFCGAQFGTSMLLGYLSDTYGRKVTPRLIGRPGISLLLLLRQEPNKNAHVQPILILSSVTSMIFIIGFGASTTYTTAILMRLAGGLCNFTFGCACLHLSVTSQVYARCKQQQH